MGLRGVTLGIKLPMLLAPAYDAAILEEDVDFLVMHIYPLNPQIAADIVADTALARRAGAPIVADKVGLYPTDTAGSGAATADAVYRLDPFSFFSPLDAASVPARTRAANQAVAKAFRAGELTHYGRRWPAALCSLPDWGISGDLSSQLFSLKFGLCSADRAPTTHGRNRGHEHTRSRPEQTSTCAALAGGTDLPEQVAHGACAGRCCAGSALVHGRHAGGLDVRQQR